jgi:hypothetical protein
MNPRAADLIRKSWLPAAALLAFLAFAAIHAAAFRPLRERYQSGVRRAVELGMPLDGSSAPAAASPRILNLLAAISLDAAAAEERGTSGVLTAGLLDETARLAARHGLEVRATEQGLVTQLPSRVQVRAHLRLRGRYASFVGLLGDLARPNRLLAVDRFAIHAGPSASQDIDLWATQLILKRPRSLR